MKNHNRKSLALFFAIVALFDLGFAYGSHANGYPVQSSFVAGAVRLCLECFLIYKASIKKSERALACLILLWLSSAFVGMYYISSVEVVKLKAGLVGVIISQLILCIWAFLEWKKGVGVKDHGGYKKVSELEVVDIEAPND